MSEEALGVAAFFPHIPYTDPDVDERGHKFFRSNWLIWLAAFLFALLLSVTTTGVISVNHLMRQTEHMSLAQMCWRAGTPASIATTFALNFLLVLSLVLKFLSCFIFLFCEVAVVVDVSGLGGQLVKVELMKFTFFGVGQQFYDSGIAIATVLWFAISLGLAGMVWWSFVAVWLMPSVCLSKRLRLRAMLLAGRSCFQPILTLSLARGLMDADVGLPLGVVSNLRATMEPGAYADIGSTACMMLAGICLLSLLPGDVVSSWEGSEAMSSLKSGGCAAVLVGELVFLCFPLMSISMSQVAGTLLGPRSCYACVLVGTSFLLAIVVLLAPSAQVYAHLQPKFMGGPPTAATKWIREFGDAFSTLDVLALCYLFAFVPIVGTFAQNSVHDHFPKVCEYVEHQAGMDCLGVSASIGWFSAVGLCVAGAGSLAIMIVNCIEDLRRRRDLAAAPFLITERSDDRMEMTVVEVVKLDVSARPEGEPIDA